MVNESDKVPIVPIKVIFVKVSTVSYSVPTYVLLFSAIYERIVSLRSAVDQLHRGMSTQTKGYG